MVQVVIAAVVVVVAVVVAFVARRRIRPEPPTQPRSFDAPSQLDRADFTDPATSWLVVVFSSATCDACALVAAKAQALASPEVAVQIVSYQDERALHDRYRIEAVPTLVLADGAGVVRYHHLGPITATDLWADIARARDGRPGHLT
jgi:hypothetical protein